MIEKIDELVAKFDGYHLYSEEKLAEAAQSGAEQMAEDIKQLFTTPPTTREANIINVAGDYYIKCEAHEEVVRRVTKERDEAVVDAAWEYINLAKGPLMSKEQFRQHIIREINGL